MVALKGEVASGAFSLFMVGCLLGAVIWAWRPWALSSLLVYPTQRRPKLGFTLGGSDSKEYVCNAGDGGLIPGLGRSPGEGNGNPLQYSCLENPMDREAW